MAGPCAPYIDRDRFSELCDCYDEGTATVEQQAIADAVLLTASEMAWILTGRTFDGPCPVIVYPCSEGCPDHLLRCLPDGGLLLRAPVITIDVYVDNVLLSPAERLLIDGRVLYYLDLDTVAIKPWPRCANNLARAGFHVDYTYGEVPNTLWELATSEIACDLFKSADPATADATCKLPAGVTNANMQGLNVSTAADLGLEGTTIEQYFPWLNRLMSTYNPTGQALPSLVLSPDADPTLHTRIVP